MLPFFGLSTDEEQRAEAYGQFSWPFGKTAVLDGKPAIQNTCVYCFMNSCHRLRKSQEHREKPELTVKVAYLIKQIAC